MPRKRLKTLWPRSLLRSINAFNKLGRSQVRGAVKSLTRLTPTATSTPRGQGDWTSGMALGPAGARQYRLLKPPGLQLAERLPLLVMLHGCAQNAESFARSTRMNNLAIQQRFLVLYPQQDWHANLNGCWNWYDTDNHRAYREAATLTAAIDQVCLFYPVDPTRIAVAGLSAGASMAALMASRDPTRFRAVAMHSGIAPGMAHSGLSALRAMRGAAGGGGPESGDALPPLLVIQGSADAVVDPRNGEAAASAWALASGARRSASRVVQRGQRRAMTVTDFKQHGRTVVTLCNVEGLRHAWSGGAARQQFSDATGPDASRMIWSFAQRQFERAD